MKIETPAGNVILHFPPGSSTVWADAIVYPNADEGYTELVGQVESHDPNIEGWITMCVQDTHAKVSVPNAPALNYVLPAGYNVLKDGIINTRWHFRKADGSGISGYFNTELPND